ncbi:MAG: FtsX-like permease family protein, partial [Oscillospiraceae bacterium]
ALNGDHPNAAAVKLSDGADKNDFSQKISRIKDYSHSVYLSNQQHDMMIDMRSFDIPALIIMGFAVAAGLIITYNMFTISINEKRREYALMIMQGLSRSKLFLITLTESAAQYVISCALGCAAGPFVAKKMLEIISMGGQKFPMVELGLSLLITSVITLVYITIGILLTQKMIKDIDLPSVINGSGK